MCAGNVKFCSGDSFEMLKFSAIGSCDEANVPKIARNGFQQKNSYSGGSIFR